MSTIQYRRAQKRAKYHADPKIAVRIFSFTHLPFLSSNPKVVKAFQESFPTKMKPTKCPGKEKNKTRKVKEEGRREN